MTVITLGFYSAAVGLLSCSEIILSALHSLAYCGIRQSSVTTVSLNCSLISAIETR